MLGVDLLDDHPAVLVGLQRLLDSTADLQAVCVTDNALRMRCEAHAAGQPAVLRHLAPGWPPTKTGHELAPHREAPPSGRGA